ncbi:MAG: hypothetical protein RL033_4919 [Pseudomonadota bacterium]|jgi:serine/threonine-protein kinase
MMANQEVPDTAEVSTGHGHTGKYTILMELGHGGSATVSAALSKGIAGFSKVVVLKTIRDGLITDEATIKMFLAEARLSAHMNHPNVVQVYEVFKQNKVPVIVMEYLDGQSLATVLSRSLRNGLLTRDLGIAILIRTLAGLQHAHTLLDFTGEPLHLVHRDVSPHNVMLCYDGQVKLVDFGIAKLKNQDRQTRTGVIKGKLNYMAPEQVHGEIDHRADIFAVGVMLWEMVAARRFWGNAEDATIIGRLLKGQVPNLREAVADLDPELERICSRALAVNADDRYANAIDMQTELEAYLKQRDMEVTPSALAGLLTLTCQDLRDKAQAALKEKVIALGTSVIEEVELGEGNGFSLAPGPTRTEVKDGPATRSWRFATAGLTALLLLALAASRREAPAPAAALPTPPATSATSETEARLAAAAPAERVRVNVAVTPQDARLYIDDRQLASNPFRDSLPSDGREHRFRAEADGFETFTRVVRLEADLDLLISMKAARIERPPAAPAPRARARPTPSAARVATAAAHPAVPAPVPPVEAAEPAKENDKEEKPAEARASAPGEAMRGTRQTSSRHAIEFDDPYNKK